MLCLFYYVCYVMLCYVMLCYVMLRYVMLLCYIIYVVLLVGMFALLYLSCWFCDVMFTVM